MEVRQELRDQVAELAGSYPENAEATVVLRGLYRLYFDRKSDANPREKGFLLSAGYNFSRSAGFPFQQNNEIFREEAARLYTPPQQAGVTPQA
ncbi:hypothetical protein HYW36_00845 [Candidatus Saccharibacteria bacterium]|nr:hypothetical protein [Candidatus Saccharibacteria bacterium]